MTKFWIAKPVSKIVKSKHLYLIDEEEKEYRQDLKKVSGPFSSAQEAEAAAKMKGRDLQKSGLFLDFFEEEGKTVWCWKDDETMGSSQVFKSKKAALDAWRKNELIISPYPFD